MEKLCRKLKHLQKGLNYFRNNKEILSRFFGCQSQAYLESFLAMFGKGSHGAVQ